MDIKCFVIVVSFLVLRSGYGQQLIVVRKNSVVARYHIGQKITFAVRDNKGLRNDFVVGLNDSSIITRSDTILLLAISKLKLRHKAEKNFQVTSSAHKLIAMGILLPIAEYITITAVQNLDYAFNPAVGIVSAALVTTGVLMLIAARPVLNINRKNRIRVVDFGSPLYK